MEKSLQTMLTSKADRHDELVGREIESKLKIISQHSIQEVAENIFRLLNNSIGLYGVAPSLSEIRLSKTIARHYAYLNQKGKIKKVFTVTQRDRDGLLQIKRKGPEIIYFENILSKPEYVESLLWPQWTEEAELATIHQEAIPLKGKVNPNHIFQVVGDVVRQKLKIRVINKKNNRVYTIGVDETTAPNGKVIQQIEIEYIGVEPDTFSSTHKKTTKPNDLIELEIATEIKSIEKIVFDICDEANISLKLTQKTKFKWLRKMHMPMPIDKNLSLE